MFCKITITIVAAYILPNQTVQNISHFIHSKIILYTKGSALLQGCNLRNVPLILNRDFNLNFANESSLPLLEFLRKKLQLEMVNSATESTTSQGLLLMLYLLDFSILVQKYMSLITATLNLL